MAVTLAPASGCELPVAGLQVFGHLLLHDLFQHALSYPGLHVTIDVMLELMLLRGQVPLSSLNPQLTRRHPVKYQQPQRIKRKKWRVLPKSALLIA